MTPTEFSQQFETFRQQSIADGRFSVVQPCRPILDDDKPSHDEKDFDFGYWAHCSWAARKIALAGPDDSKNDLSHIDFGSYAYFAGIVSAFTREFIYCDIRGIPNAFPDLVSRREDLANISFDDDSIDSVSCLHVIEHVGLGRYGDTLDAQGDRKAAAELCRILAPGGQLLLVTPMNENPRVTFNSDRYYSLAMVKEMLPSLNLAELKIIYNGRLGDELPPKGENYTACMALTK
jgi:SAM-dependent methyltransferase